MAQVGFWDSIGRSLSGRGQIRLIVQPTMALILGIRLGIADARAGERPFLMRLARTRGSRWKLFRHSLREAAIPLVLAVAIDSILQYLTLRYVRPVAALLVGGLLVWLPFSCSRAISNRIWRRTHHQHTADAH
jgi:hypothetical protein